MADATFRVYAAADPYPDDGEECGTTTSGDPISVNGVTDFTTGADGTATIAGLYVSDSKNEKVNASSRCYVLVETKAPTGYVLDSTPHAVAVRAGSSTTAASASVAGNVATIVNTKQAIPGLPLTGSQATVIMVVAGGLLIAGSIVLVVISRRRQSARR